MFPVLYRYPAQLYVEPQGVSVIFPDLPGCLPCGENVDQALQNAKEALALHLYGMEQDGDHIPEPTAVDQLENEPGAINVLIEAFMPSVRDREKKRVVKKTVTIPAWLNAEAEAAHVNFSHVLHEGLIQYLANN